MLIQTLAISKKSIPLVWINEMGKICSTSGDANMLKCFPSWQSPPFYQQFAFSNFSTITTISPHLSKPDPTGTCNPTHAQDLQPKHGSKTNHTRNTTNCRAPQFIYNYDHHSFLYKIAQFTNLKPHKNY